MSKFNTHVRALAPAIAMAAALTFGGGAHAVGAAGYAEGFDDVADVFDPSRLAPALPWTQKNNSSGLGSIPDWEQGNLSFEAHDQGLGDEFSFIGAGYESTSDKSGADTISNWLISPTLTFNNGDVVSFYTRTVDTRIYADRLQVRFSNVGGVNVGTGPTDVGSFSTLLLDINPTYLKNGYPNVWTLQTAQIIGLSGPTTGAIAFRYYVEDGGPTGTRSDYVGIDSVSIAAGQAPLPVPEPATYLMMALGLGAIGLRRMRAMRS